MFQNGLKSFVYMRLIMSKFDELLLEAVAAATCGISLAAVLVNWVMANV